MARITVNGESGNITISRINLLTILEAISSENATSLQKACAERDKAIAIAQQALQAERTARAERDQALQAERTAHDERNKAIAIAQKALQAERATRI
jgi:hypothetical protein